jgi:protein TonB
MSGPHRASRLAAVTGGSVSDARTLAVAVVLSVALHSSAALGLRALGFGGAAAPRVVFLAPLVVDLIEPVVAPAPRSQPTRATEVLAPERDGLGAPPPGHLTAVGAADVATPASSMPAHAASHAWAASLAVAPPRFALPAPVHRPVAPAAAEPPPAGPQSTEPAVMPRGEAAVTEPPGQPAARALVMTERPESPGDRGVISAPPPTDTTPAAGTPGGSLSRLSEGDVSGDEPGSSPRAGASGRGPRGGEGPAEIAALAGGRSAAVPPEYDAYVRALRQRIQERVVYPWVAVQQGIQGVVELEVQLNAEGRVARVGLVRKDGIEILGEAALKAVREATPFPFPAGVVARPLTIRLPIVFELR